VRQRRTIDRNVRLMTPGFVGAGASISCCRRREVDLPYALASLIRMSQSDLPNFDPVFCGIAVKYAAVGSGAVFVLAILILLTVDSTGGRCPGWYAGSAVSLWVLVIFIIGPAVAVVVYHGRHWDKLVRRIIHGRPEPAMSFPKTPFERINAQHETDEFRKRLQYNRMFVVTSVGWVFFCASPLF